MRKAKYKIGDLVCYGKGKTAFFTIKSINKIGINFRYYGEHILGGSEGRYEEEILYKMNK